MGTHSGAKCTCAVMIFAMAPPQRQETLKVKLLWLRVPTASVISFRSSSWNFSPSVIKFPCSNIFSFICFSSWHSLVSCISWICSVLNFLAVISSSPTFLLSGLAFLWASFSFFASSSRRFFQIEMAFNQLSGSSFISLCSSLNIFPK